MTFRWHAQERGSLFYVLGRASGSVSALAPSHNATPARSFSCFVPVGSGGVFAFVSISQQHLLILESTQMIDAPLCSARWSLKTVVSLRLFVNVAPGWMT